MSLVAYASSSGDESDENEITDSPDNRNLKLDRQISSKNELAKPQSGVVQPKTFLSLPVPNAVDDAHSIQVLFGKLPTPKTRIELFEEVDDEFLNKKAFPIETPTPKVLLTTKNLVRIAIPSLKEFEDVQEKKEKKMDVSSKNSSFTNLINILPKPRSETNCIKSDRHNNNQEIKETSSNLAFVPDTVQNRRPAHNTENLEKLAIKPSKRTSRETAVKVNGSDSSDEGGDFFSLKKEYKLPKVTSKEIAAMVSKKAAHMVEASTKFLALEQIKDTDLKINVEGANKGENFVQSLDKEAIQALIGSKAKRQRANDVEIIDISGDQVIPNKDEWLRTALASATTYQPTGVLADEEPAAGTRRKHQITYLAHKAKANEAELQAMWSANRQNRRQTQNKYGF